MERTSSTRSVVMTQTCGWDELTEEEGELFDGGIAALTSATASALPEIYDFSRHRSVLDLGGGSGGISRSHRQEISRTRGRRCSSVRGCCVICRLPGS